ATRDALRRGTRRPCPSGGPLERAGRGQTERAAVVVRDDLHEAIRVPVVEQLSGDPRTGALRVLLEQRAQLVGIVVGEALEADELRVAAPGEEPVLVEDVRDAAAPAGGEVAARRPDHAHTAAGLVLAAVVADAFDDGRRA